jgi:hypothetical protein
MDHVRLSTIALMVALSLGDPSASLAVTATYSRIADTTERMPEGFGANDALFTDFSWVSLDGDAVSFFGRNTLNRTGIYRRGPGPLSPLQPIATGTPLAPPPGGGQYTGGPNGGTISSDAGQVAFVSGFAQSGPGGVINRRGVIGGTPGSLGVIIDFATPVPGWAVSPFNVINDVSVGSLPTGVHVVLRAATTTAFGDSGIFEHRGGSLVTVVRNGAPIAGFAGGTFSEFYGVAADDGDLVFSGYGSGSGGSFRSGFYRAAGGNLSVVLDSTTVRPGGPAHQTISAREVHLHQGAIAFVNSWSTPPSYGAVYSTFGGLHVVADTGTLAPGSGVAFSLFSDGGGVSIHDGLVAFVGYTGATRVPGLYLESNGSLEKLIAAGDALDGGIVADLKIKDESLGRNSSGGYSLAFIAQFSDFRYGVYRADFAVSIDRDGDGVLDASDNCPSYPNPNQADTDLDGRGNLCECTDQTGDGRNTVSDIVAINAAIFNPVLVTPLCDGDNNGLCNVGDIVAANVEIFSPGNTSTCARQTTPGP